MARRKKRARLRGRAFVLAMRKAQRRKARARGGSVRRVRRRRRSNPTVLMANRRLNPGRSLARRRRRRRNPHRYRVHAKRRLRNPMKLRHRRIRRRRNPMLGNLLSLRGLWRIVKLGLAGGAGVATARVGGYLYTRFLADKVKGDAGKKDPKHWRNLASEVLRLVAMGSTVVSAHKVLGKVRFLAPESREAFLYGGLGETGRQLVGLAVKKLKPGLDTEKFGLSGELVQDADGQIYLRDDDGQFYALADGAGGMAGLVERDDLFLAGAHRRGMNGLVERDDLFQVDGLVEQDDLFAVEEAA